MIHFGSKISTECPNHVTMNCPSFIKNLNYFSTINVSFLLSSRLSLKQFSIIFRMIPSWIQDFARNNLQFVSIFPDSYCYFLRYLCHLRLGNIQRSNEEFSEIERVKFIGSEHGKMVHKVFIFIMKLIKHFKINQTAAEWESQQVDFTDLMENMSLNDLSGIDISDPINLLDNFEKFGVDPNAMRNMIGMDSSTMSTMLSKLYQELF